MIHMVNETPPAAASKETPAAPVVPVSGQDDILKRLKELEADHLKLQAEVVKLRAASPSLTPNKPQEYKSIINF